MRAWLCPQTAAARLMAYNVAISIYMVLRLVITVGAVYWAWRVYKAGQRAWTWMFVAVALLLNPFLPIRMQRTQWQPIDLCLGILLIG